MSEELASIGKSIIINGELSGSEDMTIEGRVDGKIDHRDVFFSDRQKQSNTKICPCVSRARGVLTVDTLHRTQAA